MAQRYQVSFNPPRRMARIYIGAYNDPQPAIKTGEALGLLGGGGLLIGGLVMKGKGGLVMSILGGLTALVSGGMVAARMITPAQPPPYTAPSTTSAPKTTAVEKYLPMVQQYIPNLVNLFAPKPAAASEPSKFVF